MSVDSIGIILRLGTFVVLVVLRIPLEAIAQKMADGVMNFSLLAIPFFISMGEIMNEGGISQRIVKLANRIVGRLPGGLALVNVMDSMFFGGISGSAVADVSSLGSIVLPMMKKQGYDDEFSVGLTVCSACQGIIIPPSHPHEQVSCVVSGRVRYFLGAEHADLEAGDIVTIPSGVPHSIQLLSPSVRLADAFQPVREDFLKG